MSDPQHLDRPQHPDFWLISQALIDTDAQAGPERTTDIIGRYADPTSVLYMAEQRALRMAGPDAPLDYRLCLAAMWMDAFVAGARFQHLKATGAQEFKGEQ